MLLKSLVSKTSAAGTGASCSELGALSSPWGAALRALGWSSLGVSAHVEGCALPASLRLQGWLLHGAAG